MKIFFMLITIVVIIIVSGCTAPFHISDRPSYVVLDQFKNRFQAKNKIKLEIDQESKNLRIAKGPTGILGAATIYEFNVGEAFSGHLTEIANNIFVNDVRNPIILNVKITSCDFSYANTMVHILAWSEIDMSISVEYFASGKELKTSKFKYHSRLDIPFTERVYGSQVDRAVVLAIDQIVEQLLSDILSDMSQIDKI